MPNRIKPKRSYTANSVPLTTDLETNELAINWADGKAFTKNASGQIVSLTLGGSGGGSSSLVTAATVAGFPATGSTANLYVATDSNRIYRWDATNSIYVELGPLASSGDTLLRSYLVPTAPTGVTATAGNAQVSLTWTAASSLSQIPITDYLIQQSTDNGATWTLASDTVSTATGATIAGLTNGQSYRFRVAGVNALGTGAYSTASSAVTPGVPSEPTNVVGTAGNAQVALTWTAPAVTHGTLTDYVVQYSLDGTSWTTFSDGTSASTSANVTGLTNGTAYRFRVAGVNGVGTGAYSTASSAVTPTAGFQPTDITGIVGWYDASDASTLFTATSGGSAVAADGTIARWADKSGNARHFTASSGGPTRKTAVHNGKDTVRFAGQHMTGFTPSTAFSGATAATVFAVMRVDTSPGVLFDKIGTAGDNWTPFGGNGRVYDDFASNIRRDTGWGMNGGTLHILSFESSSSWRLLVNGVEQFSTGGNTVAFSSSPVLLGRNGSAGSSAAGQDLCEIILYSSILSAGDRASVVNYLKSKWGIT